MKLKLATVQFRVIRKLKLKKEVFIEEGKKNS